jgi:8-oxo-dGTP diphosphatase
VLARPDGTVLLARRPAGKVYAGYWEFPGGKVESGETPVEALARELQEELAIDVETSYRWIVRQFVYPHATVRLHFFRVSSWTGELHAREHDALAWQRPGEQEVSPLLPANGPVMRALALPAEYAISQASALGTEVFLERLGERLARGLKLLQLREPGWSVDAVYALARAVMPLARRHGARVLINSDVQLAQKVGADGVHLTAAQVKALASRPDFDLVGASCHDSEELREAERLGADFAVLGSIRSTPTHPDVEPLGWERFEQAAAGSGIPVYALGGVGARDLEAAWNRGAHGVSMIRAAWNRP